MTIWHVGASSLLCSCFVFAVQLLAQSNADYDRGLTDFRSGNYASAVADFAEADAASPGSTDALAYEAKSLVHLDKFTEAETALRGYLKIHRDSSDALYMLGFVLNRENRASESLAVYTEAATITRPTSDDLKIVGLDYVLLDDYPDAIHWLAKAVAFDKTNKDAWYYLGRAYYTRSQLRQAENAFETALQLDPRDAKAENGLGLVFESSAQPDAAIEAYQKAIAWDEDNRKTEQPYVNLGSLLLGQGRIKDAIPLLETAVKIAPNDAYCRLRLGSAYFRNSELEKGQSETDRAQADLDKAHAELQEATRLDPKNAAAHYQLGRVYQQLHQPERAKAEFDQAAKLQAQAAGSRSSSPDR